MKENFNTYIDHIEPDFWRELCVKEGQLRHYARGEEFAKVGEVARYIGYVKSGTLKYVAFSSDGTEHAIGLVFDDEFVADSTFSFSGVKARASIIAVTNCEIYCFPVNEVVKRMEEDAKLKEIVMRTTEAIFSTVYDRYVALYCKTPQQRYDELVSRHPDLFTHLTLKDIASFLNITPTHLSRLRKSNHTCD